VVRLRWFSVEAGLCRETAVGGDRKKARSAASEPGPANRAAAESSDATIRFKGLTRVIPTLRRLIEACRSVASITMGAAFSS